MIGVVDPDADVPTISVRFAIDADPEVKKRPRFTVRGGKVCTYPEPGQKEAEAKIAAAYLAASRRRYLDPSTLWGVELLFEVKRSRQRKDIDNMTKLVLDALNGWAWKDDRQVARLTVTLRRDSDTPRTICRIYEITES